MWIKTKQQQNLKLGVGTKMVQMVEQPSLYLAKLVSFPTTIYGSWASSGIIDEDKVRNKP